MSTLKTEYPYIDSNGDKKENLIKHYALDEQGNKYYIKQNETGLVYDEAVDVYPCRYTYTALDEKIETLGE
jgi:hypothetical protein